MKLPAKDAVVGYGLSIFFIADFAAFLFINNIITRAVLGVILIIGTVRFYIGSKDIKLFEFSQSPFKLKIEYYRHKNSRR